MSLVFHSAKGGKVCNLRHDVQTIMDELSESAEVAIPESDRSLDSTSIRSLARRFSLPPMDICSTYDVPSLRPLDFTRLVNRSIFPLRMAILPLGEARHFVCGGVRRTHWTIQMLSSGLAVVYNATRP